MNNLTIDIGNTNVALCLFKKAKSINFIKVKNTDLTNIKLKKFILKEYTKDPKTNVILSSVVPSISKKLLIF